MFLGQAGTFLSFQARRSSAMRSLMSDLTVLLYPGGGGGGGGEERGQLDFLQFYLKFFWSF